MIKAKIFNILYNSLYTQTCHYLVKYLSMNLMFMISFISYIFVRNITGIRNMTEGITKYHRR